MAFMYRSALDEWKTWFGAWRHLMTMAFICEDFPWWETDYNERTGAQIAAHRCIRQLPHIPENPNGARRERSEWMMVIKYEVSRGNKFLTMWPSW
jgi:hypothetical protein